MAEARTDEEQQSLGRESREQVVRRQPGSSAGRPDRRKPEQRHSQGPLSSIRAVIKRTSPRPTSLSEPPADRERDRNRRRPQITILSAEPLPSTSWFPGVAAGIPPPPPPAAQIWGPTIPPSIQPPPSYEEVIREKTQEQVLLPPPPSLPSSSFSPLPSITTATQTEAGSEPESSRVERPGRPSRPPLPDKSTGGITIPSSQSAPSSLARVETDSQLCDIPETSSPPNLTSAAQADLLDLCFAAPSHNGALERPRPLPRSKTGLHPLRKEVKVQTLVKLRDDGAATLASRAESSQQEEGQGRYLQELLQAFSSDDWGFPDHHGDSEEPSQSDSQEEEDEEDMATLKLRIQAFEQQQEAERPEPRPRPRLQGQPGKSVPPVIAPKPKTFSSAPKPSAGLSLDDGCESADQDQPETIETSSQELNLKPQPAAKPSASISTQSEPGPCRPANKPCLAPKPQSAPETATATTPAPVPAPRPPPPKLPTSSAQNPTPPPRPAAAPRASLGAAPTEKRGSATSGESPPSVQSGPAVKAGSVRPGTPTKPAAPASARRTSAPNLATKPAPVSPPDPSPATKPTSPPKPAGQAPPTGPAPALRKAEKTNNKVPPTDPPLPPRPAGAKLLPLRPPPIKSVPSRPPPPTVNSSSNQNPSKAAPPPSSSANLSRAQKGGKRGPPLPPRPKPGHPLYNSYMQEVLIVLDDPNPAPSEKVSNEGNDSTTTPLILPSQELLDTPPEDTGSKLVLEDPQSIIPVKPVELKDHPDPAPVSGPRCVARFDYEGEENDELTFSRGDVIALQEVIGDEWGRGQIHGRSGIFPLNFTEVVEPLPQAVTSSGESSKDPNDSGESPHPAVTETSQDSEISVVPREQAEEWVLAVFDFPGQTPEDLSFQKGALIRVTEHVDADWLRGRVDGREGLFPGSFAQPYQAQPITDPQCPVGRTAKVLFDFTAEREDELTLKVGDVITQVESVDTDWILGLAGGKRGIVPKNYVSFL
ncbi:SH3 domain-containing protein 19 isoform X3 [Oryzias melastigma]|uniref:SH3 domain-containing protein 19 isoform X3 n=1 Tax=Oryzias melastigma TaxID=30732 RepID=UPI000CF7EFA5|nr:SH3 domain-containing protein 19 isoform X3 [Oryzias melastigma]